jgi:hypothetical protein
VAHFAGMTDGSTLASNADRERVVGRLSEAHADGRVSEAHAEGRVTVEQLDRLTGDVALLVFVVSSR